MAFPTGWGRKQKITIQSSQVIGNGSHTDLPCLVTLDHLDVEIVDAGSNSALNGGGDVRFSSDAAGTTQLACEIVNFVTNASAPSRACEAWVKVPSVSTSVNTDIYIWYNKSGESQPAVTDTYGRNAVWSNFAFLTHDMIIDSTGLNTITQGDAGTVIDSPWGKNAHLFDGVTNYHTATATGLNLGGNVTFSAWIRGDAAGDIFPRIVAADDGTNWAAFITDTDTNNSAVGFVSGSSGAAGSGPENENSPPGEGVWQHAVGTYTAPETVETLLINKTDQADSNYGDWGSPTGSTITMGRRSAGTSGNFDGAVAQFGIRETVVSSDFTNTEYNNQFAPATFAAAGTPEAVSGDPTLIIAACSHNHASDNCVITGGADPIEYIGGISGSQGANTTAIALTLPTHQVDDFAVAFCYGDEAGTIGTWTETLAGGWTRLREDNHQTGRDRVTALFYKKLGASETNPTFSFSASEEHSASVNIFRNVDTATPFDVTEAVTSNLNDATPPNAAITTVNDHAGLIVFHASTHDDITTARAPTGFTVATAINGAAFDHRQQIVAYQLGSGAAGLKSPGDWTHTVSVAATAEYSCYTLALRMATGSDTNLILSDGSHAHSGDGITFTQVHILALTDALHGHVSSIVNLIEHKSLATAEAFHGHVCDNLTLDLSISLTVSQNLHGHLGNAFNLGQVHDIFLNEAFHSLVSDEINIGTAQTFEVQSSVHSLLSNGLNLGYSTNLVISNPLMDHFDDGLRLYQNHVLAVVEAGQAHGAEVPLIETMVSGNDVLHDMSNDVIVFLQNHNADIFDDVLDHVAGEPYVRIPPGIWGLVGEVISGWNTNSAAASGWSEKTTPSSTWSTQPEENPDWIEQSEKNDDWSQQ